MRCTRRRKVDTTRTPHRSLSRCPARLLVSLAALFLTPPAFAQGLNLGPSTNTPRPGDGHATLALAEALHAEAEALGRPAEAAHAALRRLAARLLVDGETAGEPGSEAVLAGLTLASKRTELDALLAAADPATRRAVADIIETTDASILPRAVDLLLRDALAPLVADAAAGCGWWLDTDASTPDPAPDTEALRKLLGHRFLSDAANDQLTRLITLCEQAQDEPAYRRSAAVWALLVTNAARALDEPPAWLDMPARDRLRADVSQGIEMLFTAQPAAREHLLRTASLADLVRRIDTLDAQVQTRELRDAVNRLIAAPDGDPKRTPAAVRAITATATRAFDLLGAEPAPAASLVRHVRPLLEPLTRAHRAATDTIIKRLPDILNTSDPMTEPGILAAMNAGTATAADLRIPEILTALLTTWTGDPTRPPPPATREPTPTKELGALGVRVQQLSIAVGKADQADSAMAELRELAELQSFALHMPGEDDLRRDSESPEWRAVTKNQRGRIAFLIDETRRDWILAAANNDAPVQTLRLRAIAATVELLRDGATIETMRRDFARSRAPAINAWPGVELAAPALDALATDLTADLARLTTLAARDNDPQGVLTRAVALREAHTAALVIARLERLAFAREGTACTPAAELAVGTPAESEGFAVWMLPHRHALASICRDAFEAATSTNDRREMFIRHANGAAADVLPNLQ